MDEGLIYQQIQLFDFLDFALRIQLAESLYIYLTAAKEKYINLHALRSGRLLLPKSEQELV